MTNGGTDRPGLTDEGTHGGSDLPDPSTQAPTGTLVLMLLFLAAMGALWMLVYRLLLNR